MLVLASLVWLAGCSKSWADYLFHKGIIQDDYRFGDLYRLSNLPKFKEVSPACESKQVEKLKNVHLVFFGDSFTEEKYVKETELAAESVSRYHVASLAFEKLDTSKFNILLIQTVERHFRERFSQPWMGLQKEELPEVKPTLKEKVLAAKLPYRSERQESVLFAASWAMKIRECKAQLNWHLFERTDPKVRLSQNEEHLLYYLPNEPGISAAFEPIGQAEIDLLVENVNLSQKYYKENGFDLVILSILPNKSSLLAGRDGVYNHLIERVQQHPKLQMPYLDAFSYLQKEPVQWYAKGDTHWNCKGKSEWVNMLNQKTLESVRNPSVLQESYETQFIP